MESFQIEDTRKQLSEAQNEKKVLTRRLEIIEDEEEELEERLKKQELEERTRNLSLEYTNQDAWDILSGWQARLRLLSKNRSANTSYIVYSFPMLSDVTIDITQKGFAKRSKIEEEACIFLGTSFTVKYQSVYNTLN